jgi:carboxyl-terminal processing protease
VAPSPAPSPAPSTLTPADAGASRRLAIVSLSVALVAVLAGTALFVSGYTIGRQAALEPGTPTAESGAFRPFWDTYHTIVERYAGGDVDRPTLVQGAIGGMIDSLDDPYSDYMTASEYRQSLQGISGQFEGIGAEIATSATDGSEACATLGAACRLVVTGSIAGSPAERAGLQAGDVVLSVDGATVDGLTVDDARDRIRGPKGSVVRLSVQRGSGFPLTVQIVRDIVQRREVETRVLAGGAVGYLRVMGFSDAAADQVVTELGAHLGSGRTRVVLDLRGNPGGYVTAARKVASQFVASGVLFYEQDAGGHEIPTEALGDGVATDPAVQVVVLVDRGSASASEIVAGALQDTGRATLVGQPTFGKASVQQWQELTGESGAFKLTVARWLTPDRHSIHGVGLTPDIVVDVPDPLPTGTDPTLDRAVELLTGAAVRTVHAAA